MMFEAELAHLWAYRCWNIYNRRCSTFIRNFSLIDVPDVEIFTLITSKNRKFQPKKTGIGQKAEKWSIDQIFRDRGVLRERVNMLQMLPKFNKFVHYGHTVVKYIHVHVHVHLYMSVHLYMHFFNKTHMYKSSLGKIFDWTFFILLL